MRSNKAGKAETPAPAHPAEGGSYVVDPDGKRRLVERTKEAPAKPAQEKEKDNGTAHA